MAACLPVLIEDCRLRASNEGLVSLVHKMKNEISKCVLSRITNPRVVDLVAAVLAFVDAAEVYTIVPDCLGWFLYEFVDATVYLVLEQQAES